MDESKSSGGINLSALVIGEAAALIFLIVECS